MKVEWVEFLPAKIALGVKLGRSKTFGVCDIISRIWFLKGRNSPTSRHLSRRFHIGTFHGAYLKHLLVNLSVF